MIANIPCEGTHKGGPKRLRLLSSFRQFRRKAGTQESEAVQKIIDKLQPPEPSQGATVVAHEFVSLQLPQLGQQKSKTLYFCSTRRRVAASKSYLVSKPCGQVAWGPSRIKLIRQLQRKCKTARGKEFTKK